MFRFPDRFAKFIVIVPAPSLTRHLVCGDCWEWVGSDDGPPCNQRLRRRGYGKVWWQGAMHQAHRAMWEIMTGRTLGGHVLDHLCRFTKCVNPLHVEPVTVQVNTLRGEAILFKIQNKLARRRGEATPDDEAPF